MRYQDYTYLPNRLLISPSWCENGVIKSGCYFGTLFFDPFLIASNKSIQLPVIPDPIFELIKFSQPFINILFGDVEIWWSHCAWQSR